MMVLLLDELGQLRLGDGHEGFIVGIGRRDDFIHHAHLAPDADSQAIVEIDFFIAVLIMRQARKRRA